MDCAGPAWLERELKQPFFFAGVNPEYIRERLTWTPEARRTELLLWKASWADEVPVKSHDYQELESKYQKATTLDDGAKEELLYEMVCLLKQVVE